MRLSIAHEFQQQFYTLFQSFVLQFPDFIQMQKKRELIQSLIELFGIDSIDSITSQVVWN